MQTLDKLITIDRNFQTAVNLRLDKGNVQKFTGYIPTTSSVALLHQFLQNVAEKKGKSASILIGPYGKGKSHLLLVLLALLEQQYPEETDRVLTKIGKIDPECEAVARQLQKQGPYLTVLMSDNGSGLNASFLLALKEALERSGLMKLMPDSYYGEALRCIERWKQEFPETYLRLQKLLQKQADYKRQNDPINYLLEQLRGFRQEALELFQRIYPMLTSGTQFAPLMNMEAVVLYQEVNRKLCLEHGYRGIYVVFDEFSKYVEGHQGNGFAGDMKILQDMCELANAGQEEAFFITFVVHKSLREYSGKFSKEQQNQFRGVEGRLQEYLFVASARNHFDLLGNVLQKTKLFQEAYRQFTEEQSVQKLLALTYELPVFQLQFAKEDFEIIAKKCFPLTPLTAVLLLAMCEKIAQNERTLFTFLANDEPNSLYDLIGKRGRDRTGYVGAWAIYDYFASVMRELTEDAEVHNEWLKAEYALRQLENEDTKQLVKTIAILQIAGSRQEIPVNCSNIALALGWDIPSVEKQIADLTERNLLLWRSKLGCYAFKNNVGINLEEELQLMQQSIPAKIDLAKELSSISDLEYVLPKSYNQEYVITRYFQYVYMTPEVLLQMADSAYLFQEKFSDGKILAVLNTSEMDAEAVMARSKSWNDSRILILLPWRPFGQEESIRRIMALRKMLEDTEFLEDNKVMEQELKLYLDDLLFEVNAYLEADYLPENGGCSVIWQGQEYEFYEEKEFNVFLSRICGEYYNFSPKVNHELLNIQNVSGQYLKARNHVVDNILSGKSMEEYEKGTSPEAMVYRASLLRTGVVTEKYPMDKGMERILQEIKGFIVNCSGKKGCFQDLYVRLQGKGYGIRKGILPLLLAVEITSVAGTPVIYLQSKEVACSADILNNINDKPEQYFLQLEMVDGEKEKYLAELERYFDISATNVNKQMRISRLAAGMQHKYRSLPKLVSNWREFVPQEWESVIEKQASIQKDCVWKVADAQLLYTASEKLLGQLRKVEINARELLFDKLPGWYGREQSDIACAQAVKITFTAWKNKLNVLQQQLVDECLELWGGKKGESLNGYLRTWFNKYRESMSNVVLSASAHNFRTFLEKLSSYDNEEVVSGLAYVLCDIHMEDWTRDTGTIFTDTLRNVKEEMEACASSGADTQKGKKIAFTNAEGQLIERYFQPEDSGIGDFLKNAIREALDEFGDSMETGQKVAVLVETLEELLK